MLRKISRERALSVVSALGFGGPFCRGGHGGKNGWNSAQAQGDPYSAAPRLK